MQALLDLSRQIDALTLRLGATVDWVIVVSTGDLGARPQLPARYREAYEQTQRQRMPEATRNDFMASQDFTPWLVPA